MIIAIIALSTISLCMIICFVVCIADQEEKRNITIQKAITSDRKKRLPIEREFNTLPYSRSFGPEKIDDLHRITVMYIRILQQTTHNVCKCINDEEKRRLTYILDYAKRSIEEQELS